MRRDEPRWIRRVVIACAIALALGYVPHQVYGKTGLSNLMLLRSELGELRERAEAARVEHGRLKLEAAALKSDRRAIERVARDELGLVKAGEIICQFESDSATTPVRPGATAISGTGTGRRR